MSKTIETKDFIIGEIYQDIDDGGLLTPIQLELIKTDEKHRYFKQISENDIDVYYKNEDGLIQFHHGITMYKKI